MNTNDYTIRLEKSEDHAVVKYCLVKWFKNLKSQRMLVAEAQEEMTEEELLEIKKLLQ